MTSKIQMIENLTQWLSSVHSVNCYAGDPELQKHHLADIFVISHPKSGRTWLRVMLQKYLSLVLNEEFDSSGDISDLSKKLDKIPYIGLAHDFSSITNHKKRVRYRADNLPTQKGIYKNKKIVLLVRDLRDVMVSYYFDCTQRNKVFTGTISEFIRNQYFGISKAVNFLNAWQKNKSVPQDFLLIRYEDMRVDTLSQLFRIINFIGSPIDLDTGIAAIEYSDFNNMKRMEREGYFSGNERFSASNPVGEGVRKVRQGKVLGFPKHLNQADIDYLTSYVNDNLSPFFGYTGFGLIN
ncbi:sulfotransferase domain-containing protein [cf. Phormidesmis sp. LEGE 11477]|uniref:sulfotransferase domain-containing protein n=1 Tax=cf. Phormidesmis sp. LEGE 11477 TaxID=1828680 RepID=UPI00187EE4A6|nr:sulfotransferase domain-containing protein [cf. Phormidesmis sp. LEGE 11477]MBE9061354.1 sulfotransferase domain-containing protein [cf. Phormidesmis sp. LEGE 11477]